MSKKIMQVISLLVLASMLLAACGSAGGPQTVVQTVVVAGTPMVKTVEVTSTPAPVTDPGLSDTIIVGTWQEPRGFYAPAVTQAITVEIALLFQPRWITRLNFGYQANPVLLEGDYPTLENGGAVLKDVTVKAGEPVFSTETYMVEAASADMQAKQLVVTAKLKPGLKWDDGEPLVAQDFVLGWQKNCESIESGAVDVTYCPFGSVEGASGIMSNLEALDDTTIVATYVPNALDPLYMFAPFSSPNGYGPIPSHLFKGMSAAEILADERATGGETAVPLGYGPYKMVEWKKGDHITFALNPYWSGEKPKTPNIIYKFFSDSTSLAAAVIAGEIDSTSSGGTGLSVDQAPYMKSVAERGIVNYFVDKNAASFEMLVLNFDDPADTTFKTPHPVLSEFCARKAIALGLDRQKMVDAIYYGDSSVVQQPQLPQMMSYDESLGVIAYDPEQAKKTLEECGWVDADGDGIREKNGVKAAFKYITTSGNAPRQKASQVIQSSLKVIGIEVSLDYQPSSVVFTKDVLYGRNFNMIQFANTFSVVDPGNWLFGISNCEQIPLPENGLAGNNYAGWCNKAASDAGADAAYLTLDKEKRLADWKVVIGEYFKTGYGVIPLYNRPVYIAMNPALNGAALDSTEYFTWNVETWTLSLSK